MSKPSMKPREITLRFRHPSECFAWLHFPWVGQIRFRYSMTTSHIFYKARYPIQPYLTSTMFLFEVLLRVIYRTTVRTRPSPRTRESAASYGNISKVLIELYSA